MNEEQFEPDKDEQQPKKRFQFTIRKLLIVSTIIAITIAFVTQRINGLVTLNEVQYEISNTLNGDVEDRLIDELKADPTIDHRTFEVSRQSMQAYGSLISESNFVRDWACVWSDKGARDEHVRIRVEGSLPVFARQPKVIIRDFHKKRNNVAIEILRERLNEVHQINVEVVSADSE